MKHMKKLIFIAILTTLFLGIRYSTVSLNAAEISAGVSQDFTVNVPQSGQFNLIFEYLPQSTFLNPEFSLQINGEFQTFPLFQNFSQTPTIANPPNSTTQRLLVPILWEYQTFEFLRNRAGHELLPQPSIIDGWHTAFIYDADFLDISPIIVNLNSGDNVLTITGLSGDFAVREIRAAAPQAVPTYAEFSAQHSNQPQPNETVSIQGQNPTRFNSSSVRLVATNHPDATPYSSRYMLLNSIGGDSWQNTGQSLTYTVNVPQTGLYSLTLNAIQPTSQFVAHRTILINGEVQFGEVLAYPFEYSRRFANHTIGMSTSNEPFLFLLQAGDNEVTLVATHAPFLQAIERFVQVRQDIMDLSLDIRRITGNSPDINRDWRIQEHIPQINDFFADWIFQLNTAHGYLTAIMGESPQVVDLNHAIRRLERLAENPDELPFRMSEFSEGMSSAAMLLATLETSLAESPLIINSLHVHGADASQLPRSANLFVILQSFFGQFFASFTIDNEIPEDALTVWVARSQWHLEILQHMADTVFTPETGIPVHINLIPNDTNLILANAGGRAPDVALGISLNMPFQMAIRGAAADLSQFDGFSEVAARFAPGAFLPHMSNNGVFGLPETQDFYVLFYRTDIMQDMGLTPPDTWHDVIGILPELNRRGVNFFGPLSRTGAMKPFMMTAPFFYQHGADFYTADGLATAINSPEGMAALAFMADLYTVYGLPLQVANFFNDFRYGTIPIGIANLETYIMLTNAAPEIAGAWNIAPHPGMPTADGSIARYAAGSAQTAMIPSASARQEDAFKFLEWWTRTETQVAYANNLITIHGSAFLWSSANLAAFAQLPIPAAHRDIILEQWQHLKEVPLTPATYIIEREVSNIWNRVVFDGENLRVATDRAVNTINREMRRRLEEFGYFERGQPVRDYVIPSFEDAVRLTGRG